MFWPGSGLVLRCLGPGFTVLALGPGFRPIFIHSLKALPCTVPGLVEGGGQLVLSYEQCFLLFYIIVFLSFLTLMLGA